MLEIGVSAGFTSGAMLFASHTYDKESNVYGIYIKKKNGNLIDEAYPDLRHRPTLYSGKDCTNIPELFVEHIDFVYINSLHFHPWATLDVLNSLTRIAEGGIIAIGDVRFSPPGRKGSVDFFYLYEGDKQTCDRALTGAVSVNDKQSLLEHCFKVLEREWETNVSKDVLSRTETNIKTYFCATAAERFREICRVRYEHWEYVEEMKRRAKLESE